MRRLLRIAPPLVLAAVAFLVWTSLAAWAKHGLDFSVYWYGGTILNEAGLPPSDLDVQTPGLWIMASSAGVFCALAILVCWLIVLRRGSLAPAVDAVRADVT